METDRTCPCCGTHLTLSTSSDKDNQKLHVRCLNCKKEGIVTMYPFELINSDQAHQFNQLLDEKISNAITNFM